MTECQLDPKKIMFKWNNALQPALTVESGDVVHCWTQEVTNGQVTRDSDAQVLTQIDRKLAIASVSGQGNAHYEPRRRVTLLCDHRRGP